MSWNWNKFFIWFSSIGLCSLTIINMITGNKIEQAVYTSVILGVTFMTSWFSDRY